MSKSLDLFFPRGLLRRHAGSLLLLLLVSDVALVGLTSWVVCGWRFDEWWFERDSALLVLLTMQALSCVNKSLNIYFYL